MRLEVRIPEDKLQALQGLAASLSSASSMTAKACIERAGDSDLIRNGITRRVWSLAVTWDMLLSAEWVPGKGNQLADSLSRELHLDDWTVSAGVFTALDKRWGPHTLDPFASDLNSKCPRFRSRSLCPGSMGVDAFPSSWEGEVCWLVPPFHLIGRVLSHALEGRVSGTIVVPEWPAQAWWPLLLAVGRDTARLDAEAFQAGPTGRVEPWGNAAWRFWAVRI